MFINITGAGRETAPVARGGIDSEINEFLNANPGTVELASIGNSLISAQEANFLPAPDMPWRMVVIDDASYVFASTNTQMLVIMAASLILGLVVAAGMIAVVQRLLTPFERAAALAQQLAADQVGTADITQTDDALTQAVMQISTRIEKLAAEMENQRLRIRDNLQIAARISREAALQADMDELMNRVITLI